MADFEDQLRAKLERNTEVDEERQAAREEFERHEAEREAEAERREREQRSAREQRHTELVERLEQLIGTVQRTSPENVVARAGWSDSGQEYVAELATVQLDPSRTLFVELDRDDDEVLARWTSSEGDAVEIWRLLDFDPGMLEELILQLIDQELWRPGGGTPDFPASI